VISIVVIGGFGSSRAYMAEFAEALHGCWPCGLATLKNHPLRHGMDAEDEAACVLRGLPTGGGDLEGRTTILVGFSTGCAVALMAADRLRTVCGPMCIRVVLCNPATLVHRLSAPVLSWMLTSGRTTPSPDAHVEGQQSSAPGPWRARAETWLAEGLLGLFGLLHALVPHAWLATLYYWAWGRHVNEPGPEELAKTVFRLHPRVLLHTLSACLVRPDLEGLIVRLSADIRLMVGVHDYYRTFAAGLAKRTSARLFWAWGDHHMLHHFPQESAWAVYAALLPDRPRE